MNKTPEKYPLMGNLSNSSWDQIVYQAVSDSNSNSNKSNKDNPDSSKSSMQDSFVDNDKIVFVVLKSMLGLGIFISPYIYSQTGIIFPMVFILVNGFIAQYSMYLFV